MNRLIRKLKTSPLFNRHHKDKINIFISISPSDKGGGPNTFSCNLTNWLKKNMPKYNLVHNIKKADKAIVIADKIDIGSLKEAKKRECFIIHRLDEHVESNEDEYRAGKHAFIKEINMYADVTVYQSKFVFENMHPFLGAPEQYEIIYNGANPDEFFPAEKPGKYIGHITWGVGGKKRLDMLYETIIQNPEENFLLVGNHARSNYNFEALPNVTCTGSVKRQEMISYLHKMKLLFFPSENDPCPNTVVESILAGVPVCFNEIGGTKELVKDCGMPFRQYSNMVNNIENYRANCLKRNDLYFEYTAQKYLEL